MGPVTAAPGVRLAVAAVCLGAEAGGPQARAIDGVAATLRQRLAVAAEARALAAQARVSALVIALSPLVFCALASSTDPHRARFLFHTAPASSCWRPASDSTWRAACGWPHLTGTSR